MRAALPNNEAERLEALRDYVVLDTGAEAAFDDLTQLAAQTCDAPTALIALVDEKRQWFKSRHGLDLGETHRDLAFCSHTILNPDILEVKDATRDPRFADNALVTGPPHIRFYAGAPLIAAGGYILGTLAVIDYEPRGLSEDQRQALRALARQAVAQLELRRRLARETHLARFADAALRRTDQRLKLAMRAGNIGLWDWDLRSNKVYFSPEWKRQIGYADSELPSDLEAWRSRLHPEDQDRVLQAMHRYAQTPSAEPLLLEFRLCHRDGSYRWILSQGDVLSDKSGRPSHMLGSHVDITDRKLAEQAVRQSEDRLRALMEGGADIVAVIDEQGTIQYVNPAIKQVSGFAPEEVAGKSMLDFLHPDDAAKAIQTVTATLHQPEGARRDIWRLRHRDGSWRVFESLSKNMLGTPAVAGFVLNLRDITERTRAEDALREHERRLATLVDNLPGVTYRCRNDRGWTMMFVSNSIETLTGYPASVLLSNQVTFASLIHRDDRQAVWDCVQKAIRENRRYQCEYRIRCASGEEKWVWEQGAGLYDGAGKLESLEGFLLDITERKAQQDKIERLSRVQAMLSAVNTLIVRARSRAELLQEASRIAVEQGHFRLAWIAMLQGEEAVPVAFSGDDQGLGLLERLRFSLNPEGPGGQGPTACALREGKAKVSNDLLQDSTVAQWRPVAQRLGLASFTAQPLQVGGRTVGCLGLYAGEANFFDEQEMKLLGELAGNISYALEFITRSEEMDYLAVYDPLTRLPNRAHFITRLGVLLRSASEAGHPLAVMLIDVDRFKSYNDLLGRSGGDELLKRLADRLKIFAGGATQMARIGADQFAIVRPDVWDRQGVAALLQTEDWSRLTQAFQVGDHELRLSMKMGVALYPDDGEDADNLLHNAEAALKHAKEQGERTVFYSPQMNAAVAAKLKLEHQMRLALERKEFVLHYQPRIDLRTGAICGAEALIRWNSPKRGLVGPAEFIPLLEETGMIVEVGRWVLEQVTAERLAWLKRGLPPVRVAVNVSQAQLRQPDFVEVVGAALARSNGSALGIDLEVTESMLMTDVEASIGKLQSLRALGVHIAIDDFGTGYSSLSYLARLPINAVKIDRSFIVKMTAQSHTMAIVSAIVSMAHSMRLKVVAEGVEAPEQLKVLRALACDELQGFLFSPGVPSEQFVALLKEDRRL